MKYIIVTGSAGLIGSECVEFFLKKGLKVIGIDNDSRKKFFGNQGSILKRKKQLLQNLGYKHYDTDIRNKKKLMKSLRGISQKSNVLSIVPLSHHMTGL